MKIVFDTQIALNRLLCSYQFKDCRGKFVFQNEYKKSKMKK